MYYGTIKKKDIANGPGVRVSLFVSGCRNHCKNCFNPETWDFCYGKPFTDETVKEIEDELQSPYIQGLTLLGGDPFEPENQQALLPVMEMLRKKYPQKSFWCYTGYLWEDILAGRQGDADTAQRLLSCLDVLVDGRFVQELYNIRLVFRGSSNQRIIDVKESLKRNALILWEKA